MATSNTTNTGALLKELYNLPPVRVLNDKSFAHDKFVKEKPTLDFSGRYAYFPVTLTRNLGRGSRGDAGVLPVAGTETIDDAKVYIKRHYYGLEWSEAIEVASKNKEGAFENVVTMKMKNVAIDMAKEVNRQIYNDQYGTLATIPTGSVGASVNQTVDTAQYLQVGDLVEIFSSDGATERTGAAVTVDSINRTTGAIVLSAAVDTSDNDIIVLAGNVVAGPTVYEVEGLRHICDDSRTLHTISDAAWDSTVLDASGAVAGESLFEQLYDAVGSKGRGDVDTFLTTRGIRRRLADEFASQRRYLNEKATDINAGYSMIEVNGIGCVIDDDCPKEHVFALSMDTFKIMQATTPGFLETEAGNGAAIELKNDSTAGQKVAVWQAWYRYHWTLACTDPARNGKIVNAEDDILY